MRFHCKSRSVKMQIPSRRERASIPTRLGLQTHLKYIFSLPFKQLWAWPMSFLQVIMTKQDYGTYVPLELRWYELPSWAVQFLLQQSAKRLSLPKSTGCVQGSLWDIKGTLMLSEIDPSAIKGSIGLPGIIRKLGIAFSVGLQSCLGRVALWCLFDDR